DTCFDLFYSQQINKNKTNDTDIGKRSVKRTCGDFIYAQDNLFIVAKHHMNRSKGNVLVIPGPPLSSWPTIGDNTALNSLNNMLPAHDLESLLKQNKPRKGEASVIHLKGSNNMNINKIVVLPIDLNQETNETLRRIYLDAAMKLKEDKKTNRQVYLCAPCTGDRAGLMEKSKLDGWSVCNEMAGVLGASGKVIVVTRNDDASQEQLEHQKTKTTEYNNIDSLNQDSDKNYGGEFHREERGVLDVVERGINNSTSNVLVVPGPSLNSWPTLRQGTELHKLNEVLFNQNIEALMKQNKPKEGKVFVVDLKETGKKLNINKIVVMPMGGSTKETNQTLEDMFIDASTELQKDKKSWRNVYLFSPYTSGGEGEASAINTGTLDGRLVYNKMAHTLGAKGKVTVLERKILDQKTPETTQKFDQQTPESTQNNVTNNKERPIFESQNLLTLCTDNGFTLAMHADGMLGYAEEFFESSGSSSHYSIVNAANSRMQHAGGIAQAIKKVAGQDFDSETTERAGADGVDDGNCLTTDTFDMKKTYPNCIKIHNVVAPKAYNVPMTFTQEEYMDLFKQTWINLFKSALKSGEEDIVCCLIGCGIYGGKGDDLAVSLNNALNDPELKNKNLPKLHLVGWLGSSQNADRIECEQFSKKWLNG
ncbi:MAG: macro domain-containing protein, partial [Endozoicomonadaceae bacterium]|nr:macro domain-containing protein [Endozoicomonadaceae bacterium]